ncbi:MAG: FtsX-like permease family protein [bacterium]
MLVDLLQHHTSEAKEEVQPVVKEKVSWIERKRRIRQFFSKETVLKLQEEGKVILSLLSFFGLLLLFLLELLWKTLEKVRGLGKILASTDKFWQSKMGGVGAKTIGKLEGNLGGVRRTFLIALAFRNMQAKKTRSFVTVGGMGVGVAAIVFLVSVGYGLERLVVSRVARLEELKMADVTIGQSTNIRLDAEAMQTIENINGVDKVMPIVSLVGKLGFSGGNAESVVYGVTGEYLSLIGLNKIKGEYFTTNDQAAVLPDVRIAGASTNWEFADAAFGRRIRNVKFNVEPEIYLRVRAEPNTTSEIVGYVKRVEGGFEGVEYWGQSYLGDDRGREGKNSQGEELGRWIKAPYPLWDKKGNEYEVRYDSERIQDWREGYVAEIGVTVDEDASSYIQWDDTTDYGAVLGEATGSAVVASSSATVSSVESTNPAATISATVVGKDENGVEWVTLGDEASDSAQALSVLMIDVPESSQKQAVVNRAFVELLGFDINKAVGSTFDIGFVILNTLKPDLDRAAESKSTKYTITAVIDEGSSPLVYVPISDIAALGISNYSQAKLVAKNAGDLDNIRQQVDNLGYKTASVADTVSQIESLFGTARWVLATFGLVALAVASLGMFNTLTVSLMERTREVGIMKAMGMQSSEVKELFLAEAMVMGLLGGVFGIVVGFLAGKLLGVILSIFSIVKGVGWIDVSYIPPLFVIFVLVLSFTVGVVTGIYPAKRATKISALDALRYE